MSTDLDVMFYALHAWVTNETIRTREVGKPDRRKDGRVGRRRDDKRRAALRGRK